MESMLCPCDNRKHYDECCGQYHTGTVSPDSALLLMKSRYSAFVVGDTDYLFRTHHPCVRKPEGSAEIKKSIKQTRWLGLTILNSHRLDQVEFVAFFAEPSVEEPNSFGQLHERSDFVYENNQWFYLRGNILAPIKISRNDVCFCSSGKKYKKCHGS